MSSSNQPKEVAGHSIRNSTDPECKPTIEALIGELREVMSASDATSQYLTPRRQQYLQWLSLGGMSIAGVTIILVTPKSPSWLIYLSLISLLAGTVSSITFGISSATQVLREWRTLETDMLAAVGQRMTVWYEIVERIQERYTPEQVSFAQDYMTAVCGQIRARISYVVGGLDKVGFVPLIASVALALAKFFQDGQLPFLWSAAAVVAGILYVLALRLIGVAFTLERLIVILKYAALPQRRS